MVYGQSNLENEVRYIKLNLNKCHKEYKVGLVITVIGSGIALLAMNSEHDMRKEMTAGLIVAGVGSIIRIHSHVYIGRAGK